MVSKQTVRRVVMTGAVAAITMTGTYYGAQLKTHQEVVQERKRVLQMSPEDRIAQLQTARQELVRAKFDLERKLAEVTNRRLAEEAKGQKQEK